MIKSRISTLLILSVLVCKSAACQNLRHNYVVFTFEDTYKVSQHGKSLYYLIEPVDSIASKHNALSFIFLSGFSKDNLDDCCSGKEINPFAITANTSYGFSEKYSRSLDSLKQIIYKNRRRVQVIKKTWASGQIENIEIFVTPISGVFCSSKFSKIGLYSSDYSGLLYLGNSNFHGIESFWSTKEGSIISKQDYSSTFFSVFPSTN